MVLKKRYFVTYPIGLFFLLVALEVCAQLALLGWNKLIGFLVEDPERSRFSTNDLEWATNLRKSAPQILTELSEMEALADTGDSHILPPFTGDSLGAGAHYRDIGPGQQHNADGRWRTLWLRLFTNDAISAELFPVTMKLLEPSGYVSAMFSVLEPGKTVSYHRGDYRGILRYHLVLQIAPQVDSQICAMGIAKPHDCMPKADIPTGGRDDCIFHSIVMEAAGEDFLFDDTFHHFSFNYRQQRRINLVLDIPRSDLPWWADRANRFLIQNWFSRNWEVRRIIDESDSY